VHAGAVELDHVGLEHDERLERAAAEAHVVQREAHAALAQAAHGVAQRRGIPEELLLAHGSSHAAILDPARVRQTRAAIAAMVQLAWKDLDGARSYLLLIPRRAVSIRLSCVLPLLFACATLRDLTRTPQALARREVVKISRAEVKSLTLIGFLVILSNRGLAWLADRATQRPFLVLGI